MRHFFTQRKIHKNNLTRCLTAILTIVIVFIVVRSLSLLAIRLTSDPILVNIPPGYSTDQIGSILKDNSIIDSKFWFKTQVKLGGYAPQLKAGIYSFKPGHSTFTIIKKLVDGDVEVFEDIRVTIPEGYSIEQIGELLDTKGILESEAFYQVIQDIELPYQWAKEIPDNVLWKYEGYVFPDTYDFSVVSTPEMVINKLAARFDEQIYQLYLNSPLNKEYTLHELLTLASIVEKEAVLDSERSTIASVFYNRIAIDQPLQSCATVQYVLPVHREVLLTEDTKIESPYNTYKYYGIPPGPISTVGQASFKATLNPAETDYFYFNAIGEGKHYFSKTYKEHLQAINKYR